MTSEKLTALKNAALAYEDSKKRNMNLKVNKERLTNILLTNYRELMMAVQEVPELYRDLAAKDAELAALKQELEVAKKPPRSKGKEVHDE